MATFLKDLRFALRLFAKSPGYAATIILTMGLAIGATTAIFSVVDGVLLRPLPFKDPSRLTYIWEGTPDFPRMSVSPPNYLDYRKQQTAFEDLGAFRPESYNMTGMGGEPERLRGRMVSASLFPVLGAQPALGRNFREEDDVPNAPPTTILSYGLWQRVFGGDPDIVGKPIRLNDKPHTIVGVMARDFKFVNYADVYVPLMQMPKQMIENRGSHPGMYIIGRMKPGVTVDQARADLHAVGRDLQQKHPGPYGKILPAIDDLRDYLVRDQRVMLLLLAGAVLFVLLIAVVNVANLMLSRAAQRRREMAIRATLGAGRSRLIAQLLVESLLLALVGSGVGILIALWGVDFLGGLAPGGIAPVLEFGVDGRVITFAIVTAIVTGVLFGLAPAVQLSRVELHDALKEGERRMEGRGSRRRRSVLVVVEVALALVLLIGAGLAIRGMSRLYAVDLGFKADGVLTLRVSLPRERFGDAPARARAYIDAVVARVSALPGVDSVAVSNGVPLVGASETSLTRSDHPLPPVGSPGDMTVIYNTTSELSNVLRVQLLAGRRLGPQDVMGAMPVVVIDEKLAAKQYPGEDPVGKYLRIGGGLVPFQIVGVVKHVANYGFDGNEPASNQVWVSLPQLSDQAMPFVARFLAIVVRVNGDVGAQTAAIRAAVQGVDRELPIYDIKTMQARVDDEMASQRYMTLLLTAFAAMAMALAIVGLYAVMSYSVAQRTHEIGVRMALGARPGDVQRSIVLSGLRLTAIGVAIGICGALALTRFMAGMLNGVAPTDPLTFAATIGALGVAALMATWLPARRASRVDPMIALREE